MAVHWDVRIPARDVAAFDLAVRLDVGVDGATMFERDWSERIPRRLV